MAMTKNFRQLPLMPGHVNFRKILRELMKDTAKDDLIISTKFTPQCEEQTPDAMQHMIDGSKERFRLSELQRYPR